MSATDCRCRVLELSPLIMPTPQALLRASEKEAFQQLQYILCLKSSELQLITYYVCGQ